MKKITLAVLFVLIFQTVVFAAVPYISLILKYDGKSIKYTAEEVYIYINGEKMTNLSMQPVIMDSTTLVPARDVFEELGASVAWKEEQQEVDILYNNKFIMMYLDNQYATVNGVRMKMSAPPKLINNRTMIPLRFVAESVGLNVDWDSVSRIISIDENVSIVTTEKPTQTTTTTTTTTETTTETTTCASLYAIERASNSFKILANGKIGDFTTEVLDDGRLVIDVKNAVDNIANSQIAVTDSAVTGIRSSQYLSEPVKVTRIVFDMPVGTEYTAVKSDDGTYITVEISKNLISSVELESNDFNDKIIITGAVSPTVNTGDSQNGLIFSMPNCQLGSEIDDITGSRYVKKISTSNYGGNYVKLDVELSTKSVGYKTEKSGAKTIITFGNEVVETTAETTTQSDMMGSIISGQNNITSTPMVDTSDIVLKKSSNVFVTGSAVHTDNYLDKTYIIDFPSVFTAQTGTLNIDNSFISTAEVSQSGSGIRVTIKEKGIYAFNVHEDDDYVYINATYPKDKYKNIIVIDAGHGGTDPGCIGNGLYEKNLTLSIVSKLNYLFEENDSIKVYATRLDDTYLTLKERTDFSKSLNADMFVSVHINSVSQNTTAHGTQVHYYKENTTASGLSSSTLAAKIQSNLVNYLGSYNRGVIYSDLHVVRENTMPAVLCEIGFITNFAEASNMARDAYQQKAAEAIYYACVDMFNDYPTGR